MFLKNHIYIFLTITFTVYSQLVMRWQVNAAGVLPDQFIDKLFFIGNLLLKPWIISSVIATFLAGVSWMLAMSKFEISYAYPFVSLNYILVVYAGYILFNESITISKIIGSLIVVIGLIILVKS